MTFVEVNEMNEYHLYPAFWNIKDYISKDDKNTAAVICYGTLLQPYIALCSLYNIIVKGAITYHLLTNIHITAILKYKP